MIITTQFLGDSYKVASAQHDVYHDALNIIVKNCNRFAMFAQRVIQSADCRGWGTVYSFDHRTLQFQHDLLAAVWRYEAEAAQIRLDCKEDEVSIQRRWLDWLSAEMQNWIERPEWVRLVQIILDNQNTSVGQRAETQLSREIMEFFSQVPWKTELIQAIANALSKH